MFKRILKNKEIIRYILNGLLATLIHYLVLNFNILVLGLLASLSNFFASIFGIASSFLGNKFFVFKNKKTQVIGQALKFILLYVAIAIINGLILFIWTDWLRLSYHLGFIITLIIQFSLSYIGNKVLVFI